MWIIDNFKSFPFEKKIQLNDKEYDATSISVKQTNSSYIVLFLTLILVIIITIKQLLYPELESNMIRFVFWYIILAILMINIFQLNTVPGIFICGIIILCIVLMLYQILPSP